MYLQRGFLSRLRVLFFQSGFIRMSEEEYLIAPMPQHLAERHKYSAPEGHHPHVIYKRSAEHIVHGSPGSQPSSSSSVNDHYLHHHHQRHHDYQHGKLQRHHFCGRHKQSM